jgi:PAS domain S-box-containing protein
MKLIKTIPTLTFLCALTVLIIMSTVMIAKWVPYHLETYRQQTERLEVELHTRQRQMLKEQVDRAIDYVDYMQSKTEMRLQNEIKARVYEACDIAMNIFREYRDRVPRKMLEKMVTDALRPIRFKGGRGYYFASRLDGTVVLFADQPEMEGRDMSGDRDLEGRYVVPDMIAIVKAGGEGFYRYLWTKPGHKSKGFPKIAFVKLFEPFNWLVGTGEYLDDATAEIKNEVIQRLESVHFGKDGYIFAGSYDGISVMGPVKGRNMLDVTDADGVKIVQELIALAKKGGGFLQYVMPPLEGMASKPKISFVRDIPEWQWYVGAGMYVEDIQELIETGKADLKHKLKHEVLETLPIFLGAGLLALAISWLVYVRIRKERDIFGHFFKQAAKSYKAIDENRLYFTEFRSIARSANEMLEAREKAMQDLQRSEEYLKTLADKLQKSEQYYRSLISNLHENILVVDRNYRITDVNNAFLTTTGQRREQVLGQHCYEITHGRSRPCREFSEACGLAEVFESGIAKNCTKERYDENGSRSVVSILYSPLEDENGKVTHVIQAVRNVTEVARVKEELRQSEAKYRQLVQLANSIILRFDTAGKIMFFNEFAQRFFGYSEEDIIGRNIIGTIMPPKDSNGRDLNQMVADMIRNPDRYLHNENENIKRSGERVWIAWTNKAILDQNGRTSEILSIGMDVTDRKMTDRALWESEEKYRSLYSSMSEGAALHEINYDEAGRASDYTILDVNPSYEKILGLKKEAVVGQKASTLYSAGEPPYMKIFSEVAATGKPAYFETYFEPMNKHFSISVFSPGRGKFATVFEDITERKNAEEERRKLQMQLSNAVEIAHLGPWDYDVVDDVFTFNDQFYNIFRTTAEQVGGYTMSSAEYAERFVHPADRSVVGEAIQKAVGTDDPDCRGHLEHRMTYADGGTGYISVVFFVVKDAEGKTIKTYGVNQDITERKKMETRLQQAQKMESIGNLAGGVAHDFNNILVPIVGFAEMLKEDIEKSSPSQEFVDEILRAAMRSKDLVNQILAFSRQSEHELMPVRVQQVLKEVLKLSRSTIPANIEITQEIQSDCGPVLADPSQLHQIAMNLITNAFHAVDETSGKISVRLQEIRLGPDDLADALLEAGRYAKLSISDTGAGIEPAIMDKIFEPYFTTKEKGKGTGLGLAVVYGIVREHHGDIKVYSEVGKGTTFNVYLPLMEKSSEQTVEEKAEDFETGSERILLVDDEEAIVRLEKQMLERLGYRVTSRTSSLEALEAFRANPSGYDLVITDMTMPNMTGDRLAKELIAIKPGIPIIICTGFSERINQEKVVAMGIQGLLMKPIIRSEMARIVREALDAGRGKA